VKAYLALIILSLSSFVQAGDKIGNGGGLWACSSTQGALVRTELVDLFEAKNEFGLQILPVPNLMAQDIAKQKASILHDQNSFLTEKINSHLIEVLTKSRFVNAILQKVDDALYHIVPLPSACPEGQWDYIQFANFTAQDQVLIRNDIWTSPTVSELDKGALLLHEAIYRWLRLENSDDNSIRARQIVGILFSDLSSDEMNRRIQTLLGPSTQPSPSDTWACSLTTRSSKLFYIGYGQSESDAKNNLTQICESGPDSFFCHLELPSCEQAKSNSNTWMCSVYNKNISKTFFGKGKTSIEAEYNARQNCSDSSEGGFFCQETTCEHQ